MKLCAMVPGAMEQKLAVLARLGIRGTGAGLDLNWAPDQARSAVEPFRSHGVEVVQVGCYRNLIAVDEGVRAEAIADVRRVMELAGAIGVPSVICGGGHRHPDYPDKVYAVHPDTWTDRAIDVLVESCQEVLAQVSPSAATLCLEPWVITSLDSPARLEQVVTRVDHPKLAIELDPVNLMTVERYADTTRLLNECFDRLGDKIRLVHAKDTLLKPEPFTYHLSEAVPGKGNLDYRTLLRRMEQVSPKMPLVIEHLAEEAAIIQARDYIVEVASQIDCAIV